jgi:hypothetical protein
MSATEVNFPDKLRLRAPAGLSKAIRQAARKHHTSSSEWARRTLLRGLEAEGLSLAAGADLSRPETDKWGGINNLTDKDKKQQASPPTGAEDSTEKRSLLRHPLHTLSGLIAEATRVYRAARDKKLDHGEARSLVWILSQMRAMVETQALERLEQRLEELAPSIEGKGHGHQSANRSTRTAH